MSNNTISQEFQTQIIEICTELANLASYFEPIDSKYINYILEQITKRSLVEIIPTSNGKSFAIISLETKTGFLFQFIPFANSVAKSIIADETSMTLPGNFRLKNNVSIIFTQNQTIENEYKELQEFYTNSIVIENTTLVKALKTKEGNLILLISIDPNNINTKKASITASFPDFETKICELQISQFKLFSQIRIPIHEKINVFLGKNGLGKTSFLQALALANIPSRNKDVKDSDSFLPSKKSKANIFLKRDDGISSCVIISQDEYTSDLISEPFTLVYGTNIFSRYKSPDTDIIEELIHGSGTKRFYTASIFDEKDDTFYDPIRLLSRLAEEDQDQHLVKLIIDTMNRIIPDYTLESTKKGFYFKDYANNQLKTEQLSEGFRNNILLLFDIIIRILSVRNQFFAASEQMQMQSVLQKAKGIIAIDEFDRHLHPSWQKIYINNITTLLPNVQFFFTTHNPVSILGRAEGEVQMFTFDEQSKSVTVKSLPETISNDAGTLLLTHFELDSILSNELQKMLTEYYDLKINEKRTIEQEKQLNVLKNTLSTSFVGANIQDYRFYIFLKFLQQNGYNVRERLPEITFTQSEIDQLKQEFEAYYADKGI